ncbi:MAG: hypothetical protein [Microviridae sp.]|nr:MAG: hypothetical protein [Microviridae sp.]
MSKRRKRTTVKRVRTSSGRIALPSAQHFGRNTALAVTRKVSTVGRRSTKTDMREARLVLTTVPSVQTGYYKRFLARKELTPARSDFTVPKARFIEPLKDRVIEDERPICKERPKSNRGSGGSRAFIPWCRKR